jgi:8-oxo-dGTP pyrophosphatase MutT (NUDIX family)
MTEAPIPAATVIVARDRVAGGVDILMVERAEGMAFAAGAMVFPGGRIDEADRALGSSLGTDPALIAAIREAVEETAIPVGLTPIPPCDLARALQQALIADTPLDRVLDAHGLSIDASALLPFARWVPQFHAVRRFDTLFYVAESPPGEWRPQVIEGECASAEWVDPGEILQRERSGTARLIFPTRRTLERLAQHDSIAAIRADAAAHPVEAISPWIEERDGERFITIPGHLGFPVTQERLDGQWRG